MHGEDHPTEPVVDDKGRPYGGFAGIAKLLNERYPNRRRPISRQLVYKWWAHRHYNRFPETFERKGTAKGGKGNPVFNYSDVVEWYISYARHHGATLHEGRNTSVHTARDSRTRHTGEGDALAA